MVDQSDSRSDNTEREQRILSAAAQLFPHYGYDKTTVSDIAREAGVSKGAIYLHFDSKEALLSALIARETQSTSLEFLSRIQADPDGGTIAGVFRAVLHVLNTNEVMGALMRRDRRVFGSLLQRDSSLMAWRGAVNTMFLEQMQAAGVIRQDADIAITAHIMNILALGLVIMDDYMAPDAIPPVEDVIDGIADFLDRALTPSNGGDSEAGKRIIARLTQSLSQQIESQGGFSSLPEDE